MDFHTKVLRRMFQVITQVADTKRANPHHNCRNSPLADFTLKELNQIAEFMKEFDFVPTDKEADDISSTAFFELKYHEARRRPNGTKILTTKPFPTYESAYKYMDRAQKYGAEMVSLRQITTTQNVLTSVLASELNAFSKAA